MTFIMWEWGVRHISNWGIFPWITSDEEGWAFTWLFMYVSRFYVYTEDEHEEAYDEI